MRLSLLLLLALAVPAGLFAGTVSLTFTGGTVLPGETISSSVILDHSSNATGWAYSACHDPAVVELSTFSLGASGLVVNGGEPPDFLEIQQTAEGWSHGAIVSSFGLFSLPDGVHEIGVAEYQGGAAGVTTICPCELDVVPPPTTVIVYSGVSVAPVEICGDITVPEGPYFVRGDANVDGSVDVGDAIEILNTLPTKPAFVIHTGDVVNNPEPGAYPLASELFAQLELPIYFVPGNHDNSAEMLQHLPFASNISLHPQTGKLDYMFEVAGEQFLALDAKLPSTHGPHGGLSPAQLALVEQICTLDGPPLTIFIHFPALPMDAPWMDSNMLLLNGPAFHQTLLPAKDRIRAVFHGHVHQPMQTMRDGILYVSAPSAFSQFNAWPADVDVRFDPNALPGFNFVHLLPEQLIVHTHTFLRPR